MKILSTATTLTSAFKNAGRVREIVSIFARNGFADLMTRMRMQRFMTKRSQESRPVLPIEVRLRICFEELGPTFIKLGQLLASRPDIIPENFITEFEKLQDQVSPVAFPEIRAIVEGELRDTIGNLFATFNDTPLAAASIAQVHRATLKTGEQVAVKVQRPGIERSIQNDISILRGLAVLLERYVPETRIFNPTGLVEEFFRTIIFELDFFIEANNIRRIRHNLAEKTQIAIPATYQSHTSHRVLCLEYFDGVPFSDRVRLAELKMSAADIVEVGADAFFHMVMQDGLFHADLHAGNLIILNDNRLGFIDFGMVGRLSKKTQDSILIIFTSLLDEDFETLAAEYLNICQNRGSTDIQRLQKDLMDNISPYIGMALGDVNVGRVLMRSTSIAARHQLIVPRELMLLFKAMISLETLGKRLDTQFDLLALGNRLARQMLTGRYSKERIVRDLLVVGRDAQRLFEMSPRILTRFLRRWSNNNFAFEHRNRDIELLARSIHALSHAILLTGLVLGSFLIAITIILHPFGPLIADTPLFAIIALGLGVASGLLGLSRLKKAYKG
ncbi:MAG: AarF/ABC1/UbiB kinase family protein [Deltaproteobacteria bacterium]|nr:AarF/ABC1/UbiB kinase family protein [Deltaproteobacteria bacterium]MBI3296116.1 AarF/ABC1/UbiB kinase family protein [Deltaproteobacteria bacterium]